MNEKILKKVFLVGYSAIILFCMFWGFGRTSRFDSFRFSFAITNIPLWILKHFSSDILQIWFFSLGNFLAFIPFGILIPLNFPVVRKLFLKSFIIFIVGITILEVLQMITLLGSFDMEDILINTLGFLVGYISWKFCKRGHRLSDKILKFCMVCTFLVIITIIVAEFINPFLR